MDQELLAEDRGERGGSIAAGRVTSSSRIAPGVESVPVRGAGRLGAGHVDRVRGRRVAPEGERRRLLDSIDHNAKSRWVCREDDLVLGEKTRCNHPGTVAQGKMCLRQAVAPGLQGVLGPAASRLRTCGPEFRLSPVVAPEHVGSYLRDA